MPITSMCASVVEGRRMAREKLLQVISDHKQWLDDHEKGKRACLRDVNLENTDFTGVNLSLADLSGAFLMGAKLVETNLTGALLEGAYLSRADLTKANLDGAQMSQVKMIGAELEQCSMRWVVMRNAVVWDSNFKGANLHAAIMTASELCDCSFDGAHLDRADMYCANLDNVVFTGASLRYARLHCTDLSYFADFTDADVTGVDLAECHLNEEMFHGAIGFHPYMRCPEEGAFIAWKKCRENRIVKLLIPEDAERTGASVYNCRASKVKVLDIWNQDNEPCDEATSYSYDDFVYRKGEMVHTWEAFDGQLLTNGGGIHFFLTRTEAEFWGDNVRNEEDADDG